MANKCMVNGKKAFSYKNYVLIHNSIEDTYSIFKIDHSNLDICGIAHDLDGAESAIDVMSRPFEQFLTKTSESGLEFQLLSWEDIFVDESTHLVQKVWRFMDETYVELWKGDKCLSNVAIPESKKEGAGYAYFGGL